MVHLAKAGERRYGGDREALALLRGLHLRVGVSGDIPRLGLARPARREERVRMRQRNGDNDEIQDKERERQRQETMLRMSFDCRNCLGSMIERGKLLGRSHQLEHYAHHDAAHAVHFVHGAHNRPFS